MFAAISYQAIRYRYRVIALWGVLLDTFVIRPFVQPAIARLLGGWGWRPVRMLVSPAPAPEAAGGGQS